MESKSCNSVVMRGGDWMFGENSKCVFFFLTAMVFSELVT